MKRFFKHRRLLKLSVVLLIIFGGVIIVSPSARAQFFDECPAGPVDLGRAPCYMYFSGQYRQAPSGQDSVVFNDGLFANNADQFMKILTDYLNSGDLMNEVGAATIVDIMLGKNGPDFGNSRDAGIAFAKDPANLNKLSVLVHQYEKRGDIIWNYTTVTQDTGGGRVKHTVHDPVLQDSFTKSTPFYTAQVIRFKSVNGSEPLQIERDCGNLFGFTGGLVGTPATGRLNPPTPGGNNNNPPPGFNTGNSDINSSCQTISGYAVDPSNGSFKVPVTISYSIAGGPSGSLPVGFADNNAPNIFKIPTNAAIQGSMSQITISAQGKDSSGAPFNLSGSPMTMGPCKIITGACVGASVVPATPDPFQNYAITASVSYGNLADATAVRQPSNNFKFYVTVTGPDGSSTIRYDNQNVGGIPNPPTSNVITANISNVPATGAAGIYDIAYGITGNFGTVRCGGSAPNDGPGGSFPVYNKAYFDVNGGDVSAGASISPAGGLTCAPAAPTPNSGSIVSWSRDAANGDYNGAGTQFAAYALNHLQEFATAQGSTASPKTAGQPAGLGFANQGIGGNLSPTTGLYGGKFGGNDCIADYFSNANGSNTVNGPAPIKLSNLMTPASIAGYTGGGNIPNGTKFTRYIDGDLYIDSNVVFSGAGAGYGSVNNIPVFALIVKGNIYIQPNVTQLDGFYIAQPSTAQPTKGIIYTCAPAGFTGLGVTLLKRTLQNSCDTQLTVNGAFIGNQVWLLRTAGTVSNSTAAEVFNYVPDLWLTKPFGNNLSTSKSDYNAITSLPPTL